MITPEPPAVPPLYWDGCQFYADAGKGTHYVDAPYEGRYAVMFLTSSGDWAHQGNVDELPEAVMRLNLPTDIAAGMVPDTGADDLAESVLRICSELNINPEDDGWADEIIRRAQRSAYSQGWHDATEQARKAMARRAVPDTGQAPDGRPVIPTHLMHMTDAEWRQHLMKAREPSGDTVQAPESPTDSTPKSGRCGSSDTETATGAVQAPDVAALRKRLDDLDEAYFARYTRRYGSHAQIHTSEVRALLGTDPTPDRLAWIDTAAETAAAERQARYQETACARRPAEEAPDV